MRSPRPLARRRCAPDPATARDAAAFFALGLANNAGYNVSLACANEISAGAVGQVFLAAVVPSLVIKASAPHWFRHVPYGVRALAAATLMASGFLLVALARSHALQLVGVGLVAAQSGLGEASCLALAGAYPHHRALLTAWASGTGASGMFGYAWVVLLHTVGGASLRSTLLASLCFPVAFLGAHFGMLRPPTSAAVPAADAGDVALTPVAAAPTLSPRAAAAARSAEAEGLLEVGRPDSATGGRAAAGPPAPALPAGVAATARHVATLWPYMVPLLVVYYAEYVCQAGVWAAISVGAPDDVKARDHFYKAANWAYQAGVFVSRSSGTLIHCSLRGLWAMPAAQAVLLAFFAAVAATRVAVGWWLLAPAVLVGLMGGGTYVHAFTLLAAASPPSLRELNLGAASVADAVGIALADASAVLVQGCLFRVNHVPGAAFKCGEKT